MQFVSPSIAAEMSSTQKDKAVLTKADVAGAENMIIHLALLLRGGSDLVTML